MSQQSIVDILFVERDSKNPAFQLGLFFSLLATLSLIWMPVPEFKMPDIRGSKTPPPYRPALIPEQKPEKIEPIELKPAKTTMPIPWEVATLDPEVLVEDENITVEPSLSITDWESNLNPPPPISTGALSLATPGLESPVITHKIPPIYPKVAIRHGLQGYVILEATLTFDGLIKDISVLKGIGGNRFGFEEEAQKALKQWDFVPGRLNDTPVSVRLVLRIEFKLS